MSHESSLRSSDGSIVPRVGLGCMGMSEFYGPRDDTASLAAMHAAFDLGCRHFDTADMYGVGHNEELLGRFLRELGSRRDEVLVATKFGIRRIEGPPGMKVDSSPEYVERAVEASLGRLGIETIDLYYLHRRSPQVPIEDTVGAMSRLREQGKIRALGLSEVAEETLTRAHATHPITALQSEYSLWTRDLESSILPACEARGIALVAYSPLGRGFLSATMQHDAEPKAGDLRQHLPRFQGDNLKANLALLPTLHAIAGEVGATPAQVALAWVLSRSQRVHVIPGTTKAKHLEDNVKAQGLVLSSAQVEELSRTFATQAISGARYPEQLMHTVNV